MVIYEAIALEQPGEVQSALRDLGESFIDMSVGDIKNRRISTLQPDRERHLHQPLSPRARDLDLP